MSDAPHLESDDAIDAEFEPASPKSKPVFSPAGPSWLAFLPVAALSLISLILAAMAVGWLPDLSGRASSAQSLRADVNALKINADGALSRQSELSSQVATIKAVNQQTRAADRQINDRLDALDTALATLKTELADLKTQFGEMTPATGRDGQPVLLKVNPEVLARLSAAEDAISALQAARVSAPDTGDDVRTEVAALRSELDTLKTEKTAEDDEESTAAQAAAEAALALSAIEAAARRGRPFLTAYQRIETAMPDDETVKALAPLAISGPPTLADLRVRFAPLRNDALNVNAKSQSQSAGWFQSIFGDGIKVRREGEVLAVDLLDAADAALSSGDLSAAIQAVERLPEPVQAVFTDWLNGARARETLETTLEALRLTMISKDRL